jgi:hypothetical protein
MAYYWDGLQSANEIAERDMDAGTQDAMHDAYYYERDPDAYTEEEQAEASPFEQWWNTDAIRSIRLAWRRAGMDEDTLLGVCGLAFIGGAESKS